MPITFINNFRKKKDWDKFVSSFKPFTYYTPYSVEIHNTMETLVITYGLNKKGQKKYKGSELS